MSTTFCPQCGKPHPEGAAFCPACGASISASTQAPFVARRIVRPRSPRMIAGVCSGVAIHFGWDIALVRILYAVFVCLTFFTGVILYLAAWIFLPDAPYALPPAITPS